LTNKRWKGNRPIQTHYYKRKKNYNEISEESPCKLSNSDYPISIRKLKNSSKEDSEDIKEARKAIHYYYTDNNSYEWCFTEVNGSSKDYYYKCSTTKCKGFAMKDKIKC
jgi:outer membrane receptor for Fe3+-dicitrate